jgi:hypothetical protein
VVVWPTRVDMGKNKEVIVMGKGGKAKVISVKSVRKETASDRARAKEDEGDEGK